MRAKVAGVPDRPGLTWLLEQASLEGDLLGIQARQSSALGLLVQTEAWPPGASHHWSRAVKLDKKVTTEESWTGVPCNALPPMQLERTDAAARSEITPILAPFRAHAKDREQEEHP